MGVRSGDRVAVCMPNCIQAVESLYALNRLGAVSAMIHPLAAPGEIAASLQIADAGVVLTLDRFVPAVEAARQELDRPLILLSARLPGEGPPANAPGLLRWRDFLAAGRRSRLPLPEDRGQALDPAVILFSGGTTGAPKGILLNSLNCNAAGLQTLAASGIGPVAGLRMLAVLPIFHGFGLGVGVHAALLGGACCLLVPRFQAERCARLLLRKKPEILPGVPTLFEALRQTKALKDADLGFLKGVFCGGDALSPPQQQKLDQFLAEHGAAVPIRQGYGLTECVSASCLTPADCCREGSMGIPFPDTYYKICRPGTVEEVPAGVQGEICLTGPSVMVEYVGNPEETAQALRRHGDNRLWLHTGDLGKMDEDGFVYFLQRLKRIIVTSGYNVYPTQLEAVLESHPKVRLACVIGIPAANKGQKVKAFAVPEEGSGLTKGELLAFCRMKISRYALPGQIELRDSLPMTKIGKVDYRALEEEGN